MIHSSVHILHREHAANLLLHAVGKYPLVVLHAPMGYGKTTMVHALLPLVASSPFHVAVNPGEKTASYLWDSLTSRLSGDSSGLGALLRRMGFPQDSQDTRRVIELITSHISGQQILLVLDDYHHISDPAFDALLARVVRERIPGLTILLVSRTRPPLPLDEMAMKGLVHEFGQELLVFSEKETRKYFKLHGITDAAAATEAWWQSEGWAAALWLSMQSWLAHGKIMADHTIEGLLETVIFSAYDELDQRLLLQLSVLDSFTPQQSAQVSGLAAAPRRLKALHNCNALLVRDPVNGQYRLHSLFRSFLKEHLVTDDSIDKTALYQRAAECALQSGDRLQAMHFFAKAGSEADQIRILETFQQPYAGILLQADPEALVAIIQNIPWAVRVKRPIAYLFFVYAYLAVVSVQRAVPLLLEAEQYFGNFPDFTEDKRRRILGEILLIKSIIAFNNIHAMRDIYQKAHAVLNGRSDLSHRHLIWTFGCPHAAFLFLRESGKYTELVQTARSYLKYYQDIADGCTAGAEDLFHAEWLLETADFDGVEQYLMKATYFAESKEQISTLIATQYTLARLYLCMGKYDEAAALLRTLELQVQEMGRTVLSTSAGLACGYIHACRGQYEALPEWLRLGEINPERAIYQGVGFTYIVHGKALLLAGEFQRLEALAQTLPSVFATYKNLFGYLHAYTLEAVAKYQLYGVDHALPVLQKAIDLARPDGILLTLAEYGTHILPLLQSMKEQAPQDAYLASLVKLTSQYTRLNHSARNSIKNGEVRLTRREREILLLAAKSKSNAGIAEHLGISTHTVAKILTTAYQKLGAKNRVDAIRKLIR